MKLIFLGGLLLLSVLRLSGGVTPLFDSDPGHLWNRLHAAFYPMENEKAMPLDPSLGLHSRFLLDPEAFQPREAVLKEFEDKEGWKVLNSPVKRLILQRDLWAVQDLLQAKIPPRNLTPFGEPLPPARSGEQEERRKNLANRLGRIVKNLALSDEDLARIPNNYKAALEAAEFSADPDSPSFIPPGLGEAKSGWRELLRRETGTNTFHGRPPADHTKVVLGRSVFRVFVRKGPWSSQESFELWLRNNSGQPVEGTQFVLVRTLTAPDSTGKLRETPITENIQFRITRPGLRESFGEIVLDRERLFAGTAGGLKSMKEGAATRGWLGLGYLAANAQGNPCSLQTFPSACPNCHTSKLGGTVVASFRNRNPVEIIEPGSNRAFLQTVEFRNWYNKKWGEPSVTK